MKAAIEKDTIPRLHHLIAHMRDQLNCLRKPRTFEALRIRYKDTVEQLALKGLGRQTFSRVGDQDAYWSPTAEVLQEGMRLGLVERAALPSARRYLDAHRNQVYKLTETGHELAELAEHDQKSFVIRLSDAVVNAHSYLRNLLMLLEENPLICPELSEGQIQEGRQQGWGTSYWAGFAAERINSGPSGLVTSAQAVQAAMTAARQKRFGRKPVEPPSMKAVVDMLNDAYATISLASRGLPIDATTLKVLKAWGSQLRLFDQSRYVPGFNSCNVIWLAADLVQDNGTFQVQPRNIKMYGLAIARAIVHAYFHQTRKIESSLIAPYLPIYQVRAEAAYDCKVTRALVDMVLERLVGGEFSELDVQAMLHLGSGSEPPTSEPIYHRNGIRRYEMTIAQL